MKKFSANKEGALLLVLIAFWQVANLYSKLTNPENHDNWWKVTAPTWGFALLIGVLWIFIWLLTLGTKKGERDE